AHLARLPLAAVVLTREPATLVLGHQRQGRQVCVEIATGQAARRLVGPGGAARAAHPEDDADVIGARLDGGAVPDRAHAAPPASSSRRARAVSVPHPRALWIAEADGAAGGRPAAIRDRSRARRAAISPTP